MRKVLCIVGLLCVAYQINCVYADTVLPLSEAVARGAATAEFMATGETATNVSSYYGSCMKVKISNLADTTLKVKLEPGMYLMPDKDEQQRMLILEDEMIVVSPNGDKTYVLAVMCTEKYDSAPGRRDGYTLGSFAPRKVQELAELIRENEWYGFTGQAAVWAIHHDDLPLDFIHSDDEEKQNRLRLLVRSAREHEGLPRIENRVERAESRLAQVRVGEVPDREPRTATLRKWKITIQGEFRYTLPEDVVASMYVYDEAGELRFTYFENRELQAGPRRFNFQFSSWTFDDTEEFYLRLMDQEGNVLKERRISTNN